MTKLPLWGCTECGMCSRRDDSVDRHIGNKNLHPEGTAKRVTFVELVAGIQSGKYHVNRKPKFKQDLTQTALESFTKGVWEEKGRQLASTTKPNVLESTGSTSPMQVSDAQFVGGPRRKVFGYRVYVCDKCLGFKCRTLYFADRSDDLVVQSAPVPCSDVLLSNPEIASDKIGYLEKKKKDLPSYLENSIINRCFSKPILVAQPVKSNGQVIIRDWQDASLSVTFSKSYEGVVELTTHLNDGASWAARAINYGWAALNENELRKVTSLLQKATFGFVRMFIGTNFKCTDEGYQNAYQGVVAEYFVYIADGFWYDLFGNITALPSSIGH